MVAEVHDRIIVESEKVGVPTRQGEIPSARLAR